jgi:hypothetical protein
MRFIDFLKESANGSKIIIQQVLDNIDYGHVDYNEEEIKFNVGNIVKNSKFNNLNVIIVQRNKDEIRLGKSKSNNDYVIVIKTTQKLPERKEIDTFISENNRIYQLFYSTLKKYIKRGEFSDSDISIYEKKKQSREYGTFEEMYNNVIDKINEKINEFKSVTKKMKDRIQKTNDESEKHKLELAILSCKKDTIGASFKDFLNISKKLASESNFEFDKESKNKFDSRIESYYESKVNPLL